MQTVRGVSSHQWTKKTAVTLGKFDGLHRGHQKLVDKIMEYKSPQCDSVLCAFDMGRDALMTKEERRRKLDGKIDYLVEYPFTREVREMEAEIFIDEILCKTLHAAHIVVGTDFMFGRGRQGNAVMLKELEDRYGYTVDIVEKERYEGTVISSTYIRDALAQGDVALARTLLGYPYEMTGVVRHGQALGRTLGFPTMNIEPQENKVMPRYGVYACRARIDGRWYKAVGNAGIKPTVTDEGHRLLEVYVYDFSGDTYGKEITVQFLEFERPEIKFGSVEELKKQVMTDMTYGRKYFK